MADQVAEIEKILEERNKSVKKVRLKSKEKPKKPKRLTKIEQKILEIEKSIVMPSNYIMINTPELFERFLGYYQKYKEKYGDNAYVYLDTETYGKNPFTDDIVTIQIGFNSGYYFFLPLRPFKHELSKDIPHLDFEYATKKLKPLLEKDKKLVVANSKFDIHELYNWTGIDITFNVCWDTYIAAGLLNENHPKGLKEWYTNYALPWMLKENFATEDERNKPTFKYSSLFDDIPFDEIPHRVAQYYGCHDVFMTRWVFTYQKRVFENPIFKLDKVYDIFRYLEMPLIPILVTKERIGIRLDSEFLEKVVGKELDKQIELRQNQIYEYLGDTIVLKKTKTRQKNGVKYKEEYEVVEKLNLSSPAQISKKLYDEHKILEPEMKYDKKKGMEVEKKSTDRKTLNRNKHKHPVIPLLLEYRGLVKLRDAFINKLPKETINGRVHCSYNQLVRTGRMSCRSPNLQQIPAKFDLIRYAFQADEGRVLASIDFSQVG